MSSEHFEVLIVGAGFGGIGAAVQLKRLGIDDFVILDRENDLGGTWHVNHYPGLAVDVPTTTYSYYFEPDPNTFEVTEDANARYLAAASDGHVDGNRGGIEFSAERLRNQLRRTGKTMSRRSNRLARYSGLALAGAGLAHFTSPRMWEPLTKLSFPRNTRQHVYTNGGIETVLGLGFSSKQTRSLATVGLIGYLAYLGGNAIRQSQKP